MTKRARTYVAIILDRSGSMGRIKDQTVRGYNENIQALLEEASKPDRGETFASLITFNGRISEDFFNAPVEILREMSDPEYMPSGSTAFRDAVGHTIERLAKETDINDEFNSYLIDTISDGEDTASKLWSPQALAARIAELEGTNRWTFTFLGANIKDLAGQSGMSVGNTQAFTADAEGAEAAFSSHNKQLRNYMAKKGSNAKFAMKNFYGDQT